jgi:hypothetical protein
LFSRKPFTRAGLQVAQPAAEKGVQIMSQSTRNPCPEQLRALEAYWKLKRGDRAMPARGDFSFEDLRPWLGNLGFIAVERGADPADLRFRVTLSGTKLDEYRGSNITGRYVDECCGKTASTTPHFEACVATRAPVWYIHDNSHNSAIYRNMGKVLLPLSEDGITVDRIMLAIYPLQASIHADMAPAAYAMAG